MNLPPGPELQGRGSMSNEAMTDERLAIVEGQDALELIQQEVYA